MRIGVVSDTHNNLANVAKIIDLFNAQDVERVIHTGDISQPKTLEAFARLDAPLFGVFGNNDVDERHRLDPVIAQLGFHFVPPPLELTWHGRQIIVVHDPLEFEGTLRPEHELCLHGHTHRYRLETQNNQTIFNPGECAGHMRGKNAIGVVDLASLSTELLNF